LAQTDIMTLMRRGWWVLVILTILGASIAYLTREEPASGPSRWRATSTVVSSGDVGTPEQQIRLRRLGAGAVRPPLLDEIADDVGLTPQELRASVIPTLNAKLGGIDFLVNRTASGEARVIADTVAGAVIAAEVAEGEAARNERIVALYTELVTIGRDLDAVRAELQTGNDDKQLTAERDRLVASQSEATQRLVDVQRSANPADDLEALPSLDPVDLSDPAGSASPVGRTVGGALVGLVLGAAALILVDRLDTKLRDRRHVEAAFGTQVLTAISSSRRGWPAGGAPSANGYRTLRVALRDHAPHPNRGLEGRHERTASIRADGFVQVVLVTSPSEGDGRSTVASNLAVALAEVGWQVVLADAHHANAMQHTAFQLERSPGLVEACLDDRLDHPEEADLAPCLQATSTSGLLLLAAGGPVDNPATLMGRAPSVLRALRAWADYVVVDCPPVLTANDALDLAAAADAVLLVARAGHTRRSAASRAAELLRLVGAPVFGSVLLGGTAVVEPAHPMEPASAPPTRDPLRTG
jgi:capsular exopolysaccharide synthesis family protein